MALEKQGEFTFKHSEQPDIPMPGAATPSEWKEMLDSQAEELRTTLNKLIDALEAKTGTSGAENIGSKGITDLTGETIFTQLKNLRDILRSDVGASFVNTSTGDSIQTALNAIALAIETHKSSGDHDGRYNTKTELQSTTAGTSGTHRINSALISGIPAGTLYSQLVALKVAIDEATTGNIADGSLRDVKLSDDAGQIKGRVATLQGEVVAHLAEDATLTQKGHVQLSNATNSSSEALASTPKAVKAAYDRAEAAFQSASDGKTLIAGAITGKGVPTNPSDTFAQMAANIGIINTGKKSAMGRVTISGVDGYYKLVVSGLDFQPLLAKANIDNNTYASSIYRIGADWNSSYRNQYPDSSNTNIYASSQGTGSNQFRVLPDGFEMIVFRNSQGFNTPQTFNWLAFE